MARVNVPAPSIKTHEGGTAKRINPELQLRRSVMACLLWEDSFYESGEDIAKRIADIIPKVAPAVVAAIAIEAREKMKLRHVPLFIVREMARLKEHKALVADTLARVIQRADELAEFLAIYWKEKKQPLSAQVKRGLALAFTKFSAYDLAKYNRDGAVKLRDVLFLCHAKPKDAEQATTWKQLVEGTLPVPDTWEVELSASKDKKASWDRLLSGRKLGALALLRNLRNMTEAGISEVTMAESLGAMKVGRVLPFRFIAAARHAPKLEPPLEEAMYRCVALQQKLPGKTILIVDTSGSMYGGRNVSRKSDLTRIDAAAALAILIREIAEMPVIYATAGNDGTRIHDTKLLPARRGFALADKITDGTLRREIGGGGIFLTQCMDYIYDKEKSADRIIVITDEQDCDEKLSPAKANAFGKHNYLINISSERNGIGYDKWVHIDGWSEAVLEYIRTSESAQ